MTEEFDGYLPLPTAEKGEGSMRRRRGRRRRLTRREKTIPHWNYGNNGKHGGVWENMGNLGKVRGKLGNVVWTKGEGGLSETGKHGWVRLVNTVKYGGNWE